MRTVFFGDGGDGKSITTTYTIFNKLSYFLKFSCITNKEITVVTVPSIVSFLKGGLIYG